MTWIRPLSDLTLADVPQVGGKAAHLGAMLRAGFPVPDGFVIEVNAFIDHFGIQTDPLVKPAIPRLTPELMAEVAAALLEHLGHEAYFAVRSSSTEEDSNQASFAGQHSTFYFVTPNRIDQAITDCWMSLWSGAALAYRRAGWVDVATAEPPRMAVIVQKMIPAERSGVAFSRDPLSPQNTDCVIEASWGLGAAIVDGRVTPDHIRVLEDGTLSSYAISEKLAQVYADDSNPSGQRLQEVPASLQNEAVLSQAEAEKIANICHQLETLFEYPQDIEWAFDKDELFLLQARPITTYMGQPDFDDPMVIFKPVVENFTEPLTPMSADLFATVLPKVGAMYHGRFYLFLNSLQILNPYEMSQAELADAALLRKAEKTPELKIAKAVGLFAILVLGFLVDGINWIRTSRISNNGLSRYRKLAAKIRQNPKYDPQKAMRRLVWGQHPFEPIAHQMFYTNISAGRYFILLGLLNRLVDRLAPNFDRSQLSKIYHRGEDMASLSLLTKLHGLTLSLRDVITNEEKSFADLQLLKVLEGEATVMPGGHSFTSEFEGFIEEFGHRGPRELELSAPSWGESPGDLLNLLYTNAQLPQSSFTYGAHLAARDELHQHIKKPWQRFLVDQLIKRISHYIALRENTRQYHILAFDVVRAKLLELERKLLEENLLKLPGDIFFLNYAEAVALNDNKLSAEDANLHIRKRRRTWSRQVKQPAPMVVNIDLEAAPSEHGLQGQCASSGIVSGRARVIHSLSQGHELLPGEILVAPYTDPAWTPLFTRAAGIVVQTGSFLSHAGTVARELHIPCLVDVANCTAAIHTGDELILNATNGYLQHGEAP